MKVLMLNAFDEVGGAARAAARLQNGLQSLGVDAKMLVQFKFGNSADVISNPSRLVKALRRIKTLLGTLPVLIYPQRPLNNFSPSLLPDDILSEIARLDPDIIHLHWLCAGFFQIETIQKLNELGKPIVWTLHDSWAFTGGCHVPYSCTRYRDRCGNCSVLGSTREKDLSRRIWQRKSEAWRNIDLKIVTPSRWLADCARSSSLFRGARVEVIPNGLDGQLFTPGPKDLCRSRLKLPKNKKIILFGAMRGVEDPNKGFLLLEQALLHLGRLIPDAMLLVFGNSEQDKLHDLNMPLIPLGQISDEQTLAEIYSASDVYVAPSKLENLPNTVMEAMACATPSVAFRQGGLTDLIDHKVNGYLADPYDAADLADGIAWVLNNEERYRNLCQCAREKMVAEFSIDKAAKLYAALYDELLETH